ncbi:T9SS type A sorting domain-containing protein [Flavobacteriales bacterium]|nr:T9SS type A sorting domain-containing protein [Flavobacteriales bacterium]
MKKTLLSILGLSAAFASQAQVTVTSADFPVIGDQVILVNDTLAAGVSIGGTGAGQTWDLSGIMQHTVDTNNFIDPATTAFASDYPTSTVALAGGAQDTYFTNGATEGTIDGFAGDPMGTGVTMALVFDDLETLLTFPSSLGTSFEDTSHFATSIDAAPLGLPIAIDSFRVDREAIISSIMDADGSVTTPAGTFDAVRQYKIQSTVDLVEIYVSDLITAATLGVTVNTWSVAPAVPGFLDANPTYGTTYTYTWYANGEGYAVAEIRTDDAGSAQSAQYLYKDNILAFGSATGQASCAAICDGAGEVSAIGGISSAYTYAWPNDMDTPTATGLCAGTNAVTISDGNQSTIVLVEVMQAPVWTAAVSGWENASCATCTDGSATAVANGGTAPYAYLWDDAAAQTTAEATGLAAGSYSCTITDAVGCTAVTSGATVTGIGNVQMDALISIFPNPSNGSITIKNTDATSYLIYNAVGELVKAERITSTAEVVDISALNNGLYFIDIQSEKGIVKKKITLVK